MERRTKLYQEKKNRENLGRAEEMERKTKLYQGKIHIKNYHQNFLSYLNKEFPLFHQYSAMKSS